MNVRFNDPPERKQLETMTRLNLTTECSGFFGVKTINILFERRIHAQISIPLREEGTLTCAWLHEEVAKQINFELQNKSQNTLEGRSSVTELILEASPRNVWLDYWLSLSEKPVHILTDGQTLIAREKMKPAPTMRQKKEICVKDFDILSKIGWGGFSAVYLVRKKDNGKFYALKQIRKGGMKNQRLEKKLMYSERNNLIRLKKPFTVNLHYTFQSEEYFYFVMDYAPGMNIRQVIYERGVFNEKEAKFYIAEVIEGLDSIHQSGILYRDLKSENLLLDEAGHLKFCDFGIAKRVKSLKDLNYTICGTPEIFPSEMVFGKGYSVLMDYYTIGVLAYELVVGNPPFRKEGGDLKQLAEKIAYEEPKLPTNISADFRDFIMALLCKDPEQRLGAKEGVEEIKGHKWLKDINFEKICSRKLTAPIDPWKYLVNQKFPPVNEDIEGRKQLEEKHCQLLFFGYNCEEEEKEEKKTGPVARNRSNPNLRRGLSAQCCSPDSTIFQGKRRAYSSDDRVENLMSSLQFKPSKQTRLCVGSSRFRSENAETLINLNRPLDNSELPNSLFEPNAEESMNLSLEDGETYLAQSLEHYRLNPKMMGSKNSLFGLLRKTTRG